MTRQHDSADNPLAAQLADVFADALPGSPRMGLRERKKAAAMRRIQLTAVEQFEEHGFDAVTIEHIAEHAEVSPSTVYRYFGTKEGLILRDEYDDTVMQIAARLFAEHDPWAAFARAMELIEPTHFLADGLSVRRTRLWAETPSVRAAGFVMLDETARQLTPLMHANDRYGRPPADYAIVAGCIMTTFFLTLEQWYLSGAEGSITRALTTALELIRPAWATTQ